MDVQSRMQSMQQELQHKLFLFNSGRIKPEHEGTLLHDINDLMRGVDKLSYGLPFDLEAERRDYATRMRGEWEAEYGDMDDAETQADIDATIEVLRIARARK